MSVLACGLQKTQLTSLLPPEVFRCCCAELELFSQSELSEGGGASCWDGQKFKKERKQKQGKGWLRQPASTSARHVLRGQALPGTDDLFGAHHPPRGGPALLVLVLRLDGVDPAFGGDVHFNLEKAGQEE